MQLIMVDKMQVEMIVDFSAKYILESGIEYNHRQYKIILYAMYVENDSE